MITLRFYRRVDRPRWTSMSKDGKKAGCSLNSVLASIAPDSHWVTSQGLRSGRLRSFSFLRTSFTHELRVIFANVMPFDKTDEEHRRGGTYRPSSRIALRKGRKRGYGKYRSHLDAMGAFAVHRTRPDQR